IGSGTREVDFGGTQLQREGDRQLLQNVRLCRATLPGHMTYEDTYRSRCAGRGVGAGNGKYGGRGACGRVSRGNGRGHSVAGLLKYQLQSGPQPVLVTRIYRVRVARIGPG